MLLELWLQKKFMKQSTFSIISRTSKSALQRYVAGIDIPRPGPMMRIFKATNEEVVPNDFYPLVFTNPDNSQICVICSDEIAQGHYLMPGRMFFENYKIK